MIPGVWNGISHDKSRKSRSVLNDPRDIGSSIPLPREQKPELVSKNDHKIDESIINSKIAEIKQHLDTELQLMKSFQERQLREINPEDTLDSHLENMKTYVESTNEQTLISLKQLNDQLRTQIEGEVAKIEELSIKVKDDLTDMKNEQTEMQQKINSITTDEIVEKIQASISELRSNMTKDLDARDGSIKSLVDRSVKSATSGLRSDLTERISQMNVALNSIKGCFNPEKIKQELIPELQENMSELITKSVSEQISGLESETRSRFEEQNDTLTSSLSDLKQEMKFLLDQQNRSLSDQASDLARLKQEIESRIEQEIKSLSGQHSEIQELRSYFDSQIMTMKQELETVSKSIEEPGNKLVLRLEQIERKIEQLDKFERSTGVTEEQMRSLELTIGNSLDVMGNEFDSRLKLLEQRPGMDPGDINSRLKALEENPVELGDIKSMVDSLVESGIRKYIEEKEYIDREYFESVICQYLRKERIDAYMTEYVKKDQLSEMVKPVIIDMTRKVPRQESPTQELRKQEPGDISPPPVVKAITKAPSKPRSPAPSRSPK